MTISVIQDRPLLCFEEKYYSLNPADIEKYAKLCDILIYCASAVECTAEKVEKATCVESEKINVRILNKAPLREMICPSKLNKQVVTESINDADVVVVKAPSFTIGKFAVNILRKCKKKYVVEVITCAWDAYWNHGIMGKLMAAYGYYLTKKMCAEARNVVYVTSRFLQNRYPNKMHNVGCSNVVLRDFDDQCLTNRLERIKEMKAGSEIKIGTAGAVNVRFKGQQYVIEAISRLKKKGLMFQYYLAGAGDTSYLQSTARKYGVEEQVHFLGMVPKSQMFDFYDNLDIYVHPSLAEGLPRVVIEAESRAIPAVGANASGTPELLDDDCIFKTKSVDDICRILESFDRDKLLRVSKNDYERSKRYDIKALDERRKKFYNELI